MEVIGFCQNPYCYRVCKSWLLGVGNRSWKQKHKTSTKEAFFFLLFFLKSCGWNVWKNGKIFLFLFVSAFSLFVFWSNKISHHGTSIIGKSSQPYRIYKGYANGYWYKEYNFSFSKIQGHVHGQSGAVIYIHIHYLIENILKTSRLRLLGYLILLLPWENCKESKKQWN